MALNGSAAAASYALERGIPLLETGMIIAFSWEDVRRGLWRDLSMLRRLWSHARKNSIDIKFMSSKGLRLLEPNLHAGGGIFIPSVCVIDPKSFVQSLMTDSQNQGVTFAFDHRVAAIDEEAGSYTVATDHRTIRTSCLINAAGLYADTVASLVLREHKYRIRPIRGEYYEVFAPHKEPLISRLVYPALPSHATGKGIHLSPRPNGQLFVGPNEVPVQDKRDYTAHKTPPDMFIQALRKFVPALGECRLRWSYSGIRPSVITADGCRSDFIVAVDRDSPPLVNLVGIESPGLSAALALARHVVDLPCINALTHPTDSSIPDGSRTHT
ncbi:hypothetical protein W02_41020 [Nitrospira sp. KM1]|nr:hypothetical protein W02_41020 [Nitrospira sp. KM1]